MHVSIDSCSAAFYACLLINNQLSPLARVHIQLRIVQKVQAKRGVTACQMLFHPPSHLFIASGSSDL
jgi:hypothetical protein